MAPERSIPRLEGERLCPKPNCICGGSGLVTTLAERDEYGQVQTNGPMICDGIKAALAERSFSGVLEGERVTLYACKTKMSMRGVEWTSERCGNHCPCATREAVLVGAGDGDRELIFTRAEELLVAVEGLLASPSEDTVTASAEEWADARHTADALRAALVSGEGSVGKEKG